MKGEGCGATTASYLPLLQLAGRLQTVAEAKTKTILTASRVYTSCIDPLLPLSSTCTAARSPHGQLDSSEPRILPTLDELCASPRNSDTRHCRSHRSPPGSGYTTSRSSCRNQGDMVERPKCLLLDACVYWPSPPADGKR